MRISEYTRKVEWCLKQFGYKIHLPKNMIKKSMKKYKNPFRYAIYLCDYQRSLLGRLQRHSKSKSK